MDSDSRESMKGSLGAYKTIFLFLNNYNFEVSAETFKREIEALGQTLRDVPSITVTLQPNKTLQTFASNQTTPKKYVVNKSFYESKRSKKIEPSQIIYVPEIEISRESHTQTMLNLKDTVKREDKGVLVMTTDAPGVRIEYEKLKRKFSELQNEHQKLIAVTTELTSALQLNIIGQTKNIHNVMDQCKIVFPSLFVPQSENLGKFFDDHKTLSDGISKRRRSLDQERPLKNVSSEEIEHETQKSAQNTPGNLSKNPSGNVSKNVSRKVSENNCSPQNCQEPQHKVQIQRESTKNEEREHIVISPLDLKQLNCLQENSHPLSPGTVRKILDSVLGRIFQGSRVGNSTSTCPSPIRKDQIEEIVTTAIAEVLQSPQLPSGDNFETNHVTNQYQQEVKAQKPMEKQRENTVKNKNGRLFEIDYKKLKNDLLNCSNEKALRILQALRWRITKSNVSDRNRVISSYVENDFLCLKNKRSVPEYFLGTNMQVYIQDSVCRLLNTVASLRDGRDYLLSDSTILQRVLLPKVKDITNMPSAVVRNMIIATLQKLSIRKLPRTLMVSEGLLELLVDLLEEYHEKLPRYCLEYCSALVMNLCLVPDAKQRAGKMPKKIVGLIKKFLESANVCCLPYVNGIMFSLFENDAVVWEAKNQNIEDLISEIQKKLESDSIKSQLDFVVKYRLSGTESLPIEEDEDENQEEVDLLEVELDEDDYLTNLASGEELLEDYKVQSNVSHSKAKEGVPSSSDICKNQKNGSTFSSQSRSFCEETLQYYHKPSAEKGIFEKNKFRKLRSPQNVTRAFIRTTEQNAHSSSNSTSNNNTSVKLKRIPSSTVCYFEPFTKFQNNTLSAASNRYTCSCYDKIRKEVADDELVEKGNHAGDAEGTNSKSGSKSSSNNSKGKTHPSNKNFEPMERLMSPSRVERVTSSSRMATKNHKCCEKTCECGFESRPKVCRTPPSNFN